MPSSSQGQVRNLDFQGFFRARVVRNDDPKLEGRLGVFIPALITELPNNLEAPKASVGAVPPTLFANQAELKYSAQVKKDNYIWARPGDLLVENGSAAGNHGGNYRVPTVGTMVRVYFEGNDPNKPYWMMGSPTVDGDVVAGTHLGKGTNVETTAGNWADAKKRTKVHVIAEYDNGNAMYVDNNPDTNAFVIRWANGHTLSIGHAAESGIVLQTQKGHTIQLDENSKEIRIKTQTGQSQVVISDTGDITVTNLGNTTVNTTGNVTLNSSGNTTLNSSGPTTVKSAAKLTLQAPAISMSS